MGAYLNGKKMTRPYLNGSFSNAYFNGKKLWIKSVPERPEMITEFPPFEEVMSEADADIPTQYGANYHIAFDLSTHTIKAGSYYSVYLNKAAMNLVVDPEYLYVGNYLTSSSTNGKYNIIEYDRSKIRATLEGNKVKVEFLQDYVGLSWNRFAFTPYICAKPIDELTSWTEVFAPLTFFLGNSRFPEDHYLFVPSATYAIRYASYNYLGETYYVENSSTRLIPSFKTDGSWNDGWN